MTGGRMGSSPNPLRRTLGLVNWDQGGNHPDTPTSEDAARNEEMKDLRTSLHGDTN